MGIIEREGRYFVQCSDGEFEITREELQQRTEGFEILKRQCKTWLRLYKGNGWTIATTPKDANFHVHLTMLFEDIEKDFEEKYHAGESLWTSYKMCDAAIFEANKSLLNPYGNAERDKAWLARWQAMKGFLDLLPKRGAFDETPPFPITAPAPSAPQPEASASEPGLSQTEQPPGGYPWAKIEALAEQIELRKNGQFTPADNRIAAAGAGLIDALLDAGILPTDATRPVLYAAFSQHYGQSITAERTKPTRTAWHQKARRGLGLPDLKPPKK